MKASLFILLALLLSGCSDHIYRESLETSSWPNIDNPKFSIFIGSDSQVFLLYHESNTKEALPFFTRKLSHLVVQRIRFTKNGKFLLIPIAKDALFSSEKSIYSLAVWNIENHSLVKEVDISGELIGISPTHHSSRMS